VLALRRYGHGAPRRRARDLPDVPRVGRAAALVTLPTFKVRDLRRVAIGLTEAADDLLDVRDPNRATPPDPGEWMNAEREFEAALRDLILELPTRAMLAASEAAREGLG
jgi:hypothetical protein